MPSEFPPTDVISANCSCGFAIYTTLHLTGGNGSDSLKLQSVPMVTQDVATGQSLSNTLHLLQDGAGASKLLPHSLTYVKEDFACRR